MKANELVNYISDVFPYKRKSSLDWMLPISVGLGMGIAVGVGLGVLMAPSSGEHTRRRLRDSAERVKQRAKDVAQKAQQSLQESTSRQPEERPLVSDIGIR
jgi:gas vesicle protein